MLHGAFHLAAHARADVVRIDVQRRGRGARCRPRAHRRRRAGCAPRRPDPQGLADLHPRGRAHVLSRRRPRDGRRGGPRDRAGRRAARRGRVPAARPDRRRGGGGDRPDATTRCGVSRATCCRAPRTRAAMSMRALAASAHVVHEVFQTQRIEHAFLEPESTVVAPVKLPDGTDGLHVWSGGQGVWDDRDQIASVLGIDAGRVTVELVANGGAFGGKEDMANQAQTALAAWLLDRPVKCTLSREESLLIHPKRHPIRMEYWAGCDADGRLTALRARMVGDSGPYASVGMKVLGALGGARERSVRAPGDRRRVDRGPHEQPGVRRVPRLRRQPGAVRDGGRARSARRGGRHLGLGDPRAQRRRARRGVGPGSDHGRRMSRRARVPRRDQAGLRRGGRVGSGGRASVSG